MNYKEKFILAFIYSRGVVSQQSIPTPQPISQLRTGPVHQMPTPQAVKPNFALPNQV
jgi:hypothetical protein